MTFITAMAYKYRHYSSKSSRAGKKSIC